MMDKQNGHGQVHGDRAWIMGMQHFSFYSFFFFHVHVHIHTIHVMQHVHPTCSRSMDK
jgi:hypothetical protein